MVALAIDTAAPTSRRGHALWIRLIHWAIAASVLTLVFSGLSILVAHPRLYWGQTGNSLTAPLVDLPFGPNAGTLQFGPATRFFGPGGPISRPRTADVFNLNSWARSLHFTVAWVLAFSLAAYLLLSAVTGHLTRRLLPSKQELSSAALGADIQAHLTLPLPKAAGGAPYGVLQKLAYLGVAVVGLPVMAVTGWAMSPAITAAYPVLMDLTGGYQSARTLHFSMMALIVLFVIVHLAMVALTGPIRQLRAMTLGDRRP